MLPLLPLIFISLTLLSALISRALLVKAAFSISPWWGLGIFLPFGPMLFRLNYSEEARPARMFGLATLALLFCYVMASPEILPSTHIGFVYGGSEKGKWHFQLGSYLLNWGKTKAASKPAAPTLQERRQANSKELADLRVWNEKLRVQKRDLLHSDAEGNARYATELANYNTAYAKALADHNALAAQK